MKKIQLLIVMMALTLVGLSAQTHLEGKVIDKDSGTEIPFATVMVYKDNILVTGADTDFDGNYFLSHIPPGTYEVEASFLGYKTQKHPGVVVIAGKTNRLDLVLSKGGVLLDAIQIVAYKVPLMKMDNTTSGATVSADKIRSLPSKNINGIAATSAGVSGQDRNISIRGSKTKGKVYYVDGVRATDHQPSITDNESYSEIIENDFKSAFIDPLSTFSVDVDAASYSNLRRYINHGSLPAPDAIRIEEMINYFNYDYDQPTDDVPFSMQTEVGACPWNEDNLLMHIGIEGKKISLEDLPPSNIVFLIDVSGSMSSQNKLPLLKSSFNLLVENLRKEDKVAIVVYAGSTGLVLESTPGDKRLDILNSLKNLKSGGSTSGAAGLELAYKVAIENFIKKGNNRIILATDGDFNVGPRSDSEMKDLIIKNRDKGVSISVLGFGMGNYKDSKMEIIADNGNGNYYYIDNLLEARKVLVKEMGGTLHTIAKDVKLQLEFNPHLVSSYRLIGYENRILNKEDFSDDKKDAGDIGSGHTVTAIYELFLSDRTEESKGDLKYQKHQLTHEAYKNNELLTLKLRYKEPKGSQSKLIEQPVINTVINDNELSDNFNFSAAVAQYGMLLRDSKYINQESWDATINLAKSGKGNDPEGYRSELIDMMEVSKVLKQNAYSTTD